MILINPKSTKFGIFERYVPISVPFGIGYLAGYLISQNKNVQIIDEHIEPISKEILESSVKKLSPPYIFGISTLTASIKRCFEIVKIIKSLYPESKVVLGGIHSSVLPDEVLGNNNVDFVVRREGEEIINELYEAIKNGKDYSKIKGISFKNNGQIIHNPLAELPDLSRIPSFPYHLFEKHIDRYNFGFIASSRGCPYDCIFCSQRTISGQKLRFVSINVVMNEIDLLVNKYGQKRIVFVDDNFTANKQRTIELAEAIIKKRFYEKATFDCQTRTDEIDDEILVILKKAGFRIIDFGFETSSERLMVLLNKKETVQENIEAVKLVKKYGFGVSGTFIFGLPTESREERWQSYKLAKDLGLDYARFNNATPYPGTRLYEIAREEGRLFIEKDWSNLNACGSLVQDPSTGSKLPYVPIGCDEKTLIKDIIRANLYFYLSPRKIFSLLFKKADPVGWFHLSPTWYLKTEEWFSLLKLGMKLLKIFIKCYI